MAYGLTKSWDLESSSSQYGTIADSAAIRVVNGWSVETWVKMESLVNCYLLNVRSGENGWGLGLNSSGNVTVYAGSGAFGNTTSSAVLSTGTWYHIGVYFNGTGTKLYINGGTAETLANANISNPNGTLYLSRKATGASDYFDGTMSLLRIWNTERTQANFADNMCNVLGATTNLQVEYTLNDTYADNLGVGGTISPSGSPVFATDVPSVCAVVGPANLKTYNTNAKANIKTMNTNPIANVKTFDTNA